MLLKNKTFLILIFSALQMLLFSNNLDARSPDSDFISSLVIRDLHTGKVVLQKNPHLLMKPASLQKISVAHVVLKMLGPQFRFQTNLVQGTQHAHLYFSGDPTITFRKLVDFFKSLRKKGIRRLKGDLHINQNLNALYDHPSGWTIESTRFLYGAIVSPISINRNGLCFRVYPPKFYGNKTRVHMDQNQPPYPSRNLMTVGTCAKGKGVKRSDFSFDGEKIVVRGCVTPGQSNLRACVPILPAQFQGYVAHSIKRALYQAGIDFTGRIIFSRRLIPGQTLGTLYSEPLSLLLEEGMKDSRNAVMEALIFPLAQKKYLSFQEEEAVEKFLSKTLSTTDQDFKRARMVDMSGLSHHNLVSASMLEKLLWVVYSNPRTFTLWKRFLAISEKDGTLKGRFKGWGPHTVIRGKTGALLSTQNIAGYLWHQNKPRFSFVIMVQNFTKQSSQIKAIHEKILKDFLSKHCK